MKQIVVLLVAIALCLSCTFVTPSNTATKRAPIIKMDPSSAAEQLDNIVLYHDISYESTQVIEPVFYQVPFDLEIQLFVKAASSWYGFDDMLIWQIAYCESGWNIKNHIPGNACKGLMAVSTKYAPAYCHYNDHFDDLFTQGFDPYNVKQNIVIALRMLSYWDKICCQRGEYGIESILECYNRGFQYFRNKKNIKYSQKVLTTCVNVI